MLHVLKIVKPLTDADFSTSKSQSNVCLKLRQWAILCSILVVILTAVGTTCSFLGSVHTKELLQLLEDDIEREKERKVYEYYPQPGISLNEVKLLQSRDLVYMYNKILTVCGWIGWFNLIIGGIMIYGVITTNSICILPWILLNLITQLVGTGTVTLMYSGSIPGLYISFTIFCVCFISSLTFLMMWLVIAFYTFKLNYVVLSRRASLPPTMIHAYGGYTHTIQPVLMMNNPQKPLM